MTLTLDKLITSIELTNLSPSSEYKIYFNNAENGICSRIKPYPDSLLNSLAWVGLTQGKLLVIGDDIKDVLQANYLINAGYEVETLIVLRQSFNEELEIKRLEKAIYEQTILKNQTKINIVPSLAHTIPYCKGANAVIIDLDGTLVRNPIQRDDRINTRLGKFKYANGWPVNPCYGMFNSYQVFQHGMYMILEKVFNHKIIRPFPGPENALYPFFNALFKLKQVYGTKTFINTNGPGITGNYYLKREVLGVKPVNCPVFRP